jgi:hypothetical protein
MAKIMPFISAGLPLAAAKIVHFIGWISTLLDSHHLLRTHVLEVSMGRQLTPIGGLLSGRTEARSVAFLSSQKLINSGKMITGRSS